VGKAELVPARRFRPDRLRKKTNPEEQFPARKLLSPATLKPSHEESYNSKALHPAERTLAAFPAPTQVKTSKENPNDRFEQSRSRES
jgi:hypothetical protein